MKDITVTQRDGRVTQLDQVYIRGPMIRFYIVPDMLQNAPMFKRIGAGAMKGRGIGTARGRATIARATCASCMAPSSVSNTQELTCMSNVHSAKRRRRPWRWWQRWSPWQTVNTRNAFRGTCITKWDEVRCCPAVKLSSTRLKYALLQPKVGCRKANSLLLEDHQK